MGSFTVKDYPKENVPNLGCLANMYSPETSLARRNEFHFAASVRLPRMGAMLLLINTEADRTFHGSKWKDSLIDSILRLRQRSRTFLLP